MSNNPGWFPQPDGQERYHDGNDWTDQYRPAQPAGAGAGSYAPPQQQKKNGALKWILITLGALVLFCGGGFAACSAGVIGAANEVSKSIEAEESEVGGTQNALTIEEGKAFDVRGFEYADGWKVADDGLGGTTIEGLKVTNNRDSADTALVEIKFMKGDEILASVDCSSDQLQKGQSATLSCIGATEKAEGYDRITINDTF